LNRSRAKEIAERPHPTDSLQELRRKYGGPGVCDEEILLRFFSSKEEVDKMRAAGPPRSYATNGNPLLNLVEELTRRPRRSSVYIRRGNLTLRLEKRQ